jgi:ubiquinone/menaquinone biosynthesis C-methylase UbiE
VAYEHLAFHYDALMRKMDYGAYADHLLSLAGHPTSVLDLACGTGRLTEELCKRGCDVVAADGSAEMLTVAQSRDYDACGGPPPLFLQQDMTKLDLYGTVEAAFCTIDALNYLTTEESLIKTMSRVRLFLEPGGAFVFDMLTPDAFAARDGAVFMSDAEGVYCTWRCSYIAPFCHQEITLFAKQDGGLWERRDENHIERAYDLDFVESALKEAGFSDISRCGMYDKETTRKDDERVVFTAR